MPSAGVFAFLLLPVFFLASLHTHHHPRNLTTLSPHSVIHSVSHLSAVPSAQPSKGPSRPIHHFLSQHRASIYRHGLPSWNTQRDTRNKVSSSNPPGATLAFDVRVFVVHGFVVRAEPFAFLPFHHLRGRDLHARRTDRLIAATTITQVKGPFAARQVRVSPRPVQAKVAYLHYIHSLARVRERERVCVCLHCPYLQDTNALVRSHRCASPKVSSRGLVFKAIVQFVICSGLPSALPFSRGSPSFQHAQHPWLEPSSHLTISHDIEA